MTFEEDYRDFIPKEDITLKEVAMILRIIKLSVDFKRVDIPDDLKRHFKKMEIKE